MLRKVLLAFGLSAALVLALCGDALASEGGDGGGHSFEYNGEEWTKVIWTGLAPENIANPLGTKHTGFCVRAWNNLDATACAIGRDHNAPDLVARYKLSTAEYGGRFYELSQKFGTNGVQYPPWFAATWLLDADYKTYGIDYAKYIYWAYPVEESELEGARQDFDTIVNGGSLGGNPSGSLPDFTDGYMPLIFGDAEGSGATAKYNITMDAASASYFTSQVMNTHPFYLIGEVQAWRNGAWTGYGAYAVFCDYPFELSGNGPGLVLTASDSSATFRVKYVNNATFQGNVMVSSYKNINSITEVNASTYTIDRSGGSYSYVRVFGYKDVGEGGNVQPPDDEPNPWPPTTDPDPDPDPPDVPTVPTFPVYGGDTYVNNDYTWNTTNYYENDFSDVLAGIQEILDAMDSHCIHLQNAIGNAVNNLSNNITNGLNMLADNVNGSLHSEFTALKDYLRQLFQWLAEQFHYTFGQTSMFDDTSILTWLKRIYSRLLGMGRETPTPDPVDDPIGFWDWLLKQFGDFFAGFTSDKASQVGSLLQSLTQFFPFSIPWDLAFMAGLLVAQPVTPVLDIPIPVPAVINNNQRILVHIDCTGWNNAASICRLVMYFLFCYALAQRVPEWFNTIKVGDNW